jgi:nitroimidazol reductase NimA-like FMN-containing flavoprotein (pyridoxamine 5'-phosphate oxidase superfamily)
MRPARPSPPPELSAPSAPSAPSARTTLRRLPERGRYDRATVDAVLDEALICHLGLVDADGRPFVVPTIHARVGDHLYVHGSPASRALRAAGLDEAEACVVATLVDGLVLARSAFHHSINYRSVVVYGSASRVDDLDEKATALHAIVEHVVAGRAEGCRPPDDRELRATLVLRLALDEASAKVRSGGPKDDDDDLALPVWAGHVPVHLVAGDPVADVGVTAAWPGYDVAARGPDGVSRPAD